MSVRNFILGVINCSKVSDVNDILSQYATEAKDTPSYIYFSKQPIDTNNISNDVIFFKIIAENDSLLNKQVENLINDLNNLKTDYVLRDEKTGEFLVTVKYGGQVAIKFDNVKFLKKDIYKKIDGLKYTNTKYGYCKGFKPNFRPLEGKSAKNLEILPEIIYITSDSKENLLKLSDYVSKKVKEIDPNLETEFKWFFR